MKKLITFFKQHNGYARMKDLKTAGIHTRDIAAAVSERHIEKIKPGLYKLSSFPWDARSGFIDVCRAKEGAVICLSSALEYHSLTTFNPSEITVAVPHHTDRFRIEYPPVSVFYFPERFYRLGISEVKSKSGTFRIYCKEKTVCDMFRYRKKLGEDLAVEGLKTYLRSKGANLSLLQEYAVKCQVKTFMLPYLRALVG